MSRFWTQAQDDMMREFYPNHCMRDLIAMLGKSQGAIYSRADILKLNKTEEYLSSPFACRFKREQTEAQKATRFVKGQVSWNKGLSYQPKGNAVKTQFKKGIVPPNRRDVGSIRLVDGYQEIKVAEGMRQWKQLHRVIWERLNGDIPKSMILVFRDKNKLNTSITNLELITRQQNMKRNSYHENYPKEIQILIQLTGAVNRQINKRERAIT